MPSALLHLSTKCQKQKDKKWFGYGNFLNAAHNDTQNRLPSLCVFLSSLCFSIPLFPCLPVSLSLSLCVSPSLSLYSCLPTVCVSLCSERSHLQLCQGVSGGGGEPPFPQLWHGPKVVPAAEHHLGKSRTSQRGLQCHHGDVQVNLHAVMLRGFVLLHLQRSTILSLKRTLDSVNTHALR